MLLGNFQHRGVLLTWFIEEQGPDVLAVDAGRVVWILFISSITFSLFVFPSLWETIQYRLQYFLKGPLNSKLPTIQQIK